LSFVSKGNKMIMLVFILIVVIFGVGLLFFIQKQTTGARSKLVNKQVVQKKWQEIEIMMDTGGPANFQSAVMEADKLFAYVLKGVVGSRDGQNMGDRLKLAQKKFSNYQIYQGIWSAHKLRNKIAHEIGHEIHSSSVKQAISQFKKGLKDLKVL